MTTNEPQHPPTTAASDDPRPSLKKILRSPVKRFGDLPLESQLHDPIAGIFEGDTSCSPSFSYISTNVNEPLTLFLVLDKEDDVNEFFEAQNAWESAGDLYTYTVFGPGMQPLSLVRQHPRALWTKKRTVYLPPALDSPVGVVVDKKGAKKAAVGPAMFNVKKSAFGGNPTYYAYLGAHQGMHLDSAAHPLYKKPFLVMSTSNSRTEIARHFKFTACVTSIRTPSGDPAVDQVMAVERKSQLVVLASGKMRDLFVFLRPGGDKWSWSNEHAPGMLIATGRPCTFDTIKSVFAGPETVRIEVAAGVDARVVLAVVLATITHFQTY